MSFSLGSSGFERVFLQTQRSRFAAPYAERSELKASVTNALLGRMCRRILKEFASGVQEPGTRKLLISNALFVLASQHRRRPSFPNLAKGK
jgi:hypothetical protein